MERGIERDGGNTQDALGGIGHSIGLHVGRQCRCIVAHALMAQHHTLWTARGTARIDQIGEVVGSQCCLRLRGVFRLKQFFCHFGCDDQFRTTVLKNQFHAVGGVFRVARDIGGTGLLHTEHGEDKPAGTRQQ